MSMPKEVVINNTRYVAVPVEEKEEPSDEFGRCMCHLFLGLLKYLCCFGIIFILMIILSMKSPEDLQKHTWKPTPPTTTIVEMRINPSAMDSATDLEDIPLRRGYKTKFPRS